MKHIGKIAGLALSAVMALTMTAPAFASDYSFTTTALQDYYNSTSYEDVYGSQYNYGGRNVVDYDIPELEYGRMSTTMTGVMERTILPGLQQVVASTDGSGYGLGGENGGGGGPLTELVLEDGTLKIAKLGISVKVWEGESTTSMAKGVGHYSSTSAWDGNVGLAGHNRGAKYNIGTIKNLVAGDTITYTTMYGTRTYQVTSVKTITNTDWSYLQGTADNRITITTCLENHPESRVCVQAVEVK